IKLSPSCAHFSRQSASYLTVSNTDHHMPYFAHSGILHDKSDWQSLREHLQAVAKLAAELAEHLGLEKAAYTAGLFHDLGKYNPDFQLRLEGQNIRVDHSTAGAAVLTKLA